MLKLGKIHGSSDLHILLHIWDLVSEMLSFVFPENRKCPQEENNRATIIPYAIILFIFEENFF